MPPSRRTFSFIIIFLSVGFVCCEHLLEKEIYSSEKFPSAKTPQPLLGSSLLKTPPSSPDLILAAQRLLLKPRPIFNDVGTQPMKTEPFVVRPPCQEASNINKSPPIWFSNTPKPYQGFPIVTTSESFPVETRPTLYQPVSPQLALPQISPMLTEYPVMLDQNPSPMVPLSYNPVAQPPFFPDPVRVDNYLQNPELSQFYSVLPQQTNAPANTAYAAFLTPAAINPTYSTISNFPTVNEIISEALPFVQSAPVFTDYGFNSVESLPVYAQPPFNFQINLSPPPEQPIIMISPPAPTSAVLDFNDVSPMPQPSIPPPVIVIEESNSSWKSLLPILLIALNDRCSNNCCNCCVGSNNIPIPYPIPIPTNNPIITGGDKGKEKTSKCDEDKCD